MRPDPTVLRYFAASGLALGIDLALFTLLLHLGAPSPAAAAAGYSLGIVVHWIVSSRAVFVGGVAARGAPRNWQKALFVGSALCGLAVTTLIATTAALLAVDPHLAKLVAVAASFVLTWQLRERVVFRRGAVR